MPSSKKTPSGFNLYELNDEPAMEDFNADNELADELIQDLQDEVKEKVGQEELTTVSNAVLDAKTAAESAQTTANQAKTTAEAAQTTAGEAKTAAESAQGTAGTALSTANTANTTANAAIPKAGGAFTGAVTAANTSATTAQIRNIQIVTSEPTTFPNGVITFLVEG